MKEETRNEIIAEIKEYCSQNNEDFDLMCEQALRNWGRKEPVPMEFSDLINEMLQEWFWDNFAAEDFV